MDIAKQGASFNAEGDETTATQFDYKPNLNCN
jgi:hypothetical protein